MKEIEGWQQVPITKIREDIIEQLKAQYANDNLSIEDFEDRLVKAEEAGTKGLLLDIVSDLPLLRMEKSAPAAGSEDYLINYGNVQNDGVVFAVLSGATRKGMWKPPRHLKVFTTMGGIDLDFSKAELPPQGVKIDLFAIMGGVDIIVPENVNVEVTGIPLLGGFDDKSGGYADPEAPTIKIRGLVIMGGVDIKTRKK